MVEQQNIRRCFSLSVVVLLLDCVHVATPKSREGPLTNAERKAFLSTHNNFRRDATKEFEGTKQPPAANMKRMYWSAGLEAETVAWTVRMVAKGNWDHGFSDVKNVGEIMNMLSIKEPSDLGQNIAEGIEDAATIVRAWYGETKQYTLKNHECAKDTDCGHYTQVMWAESHFLGCAFGQKDGIAMFATCDYFPPGNYEGVGPYKDGASCSLCNAYAKEGFTECEDGLCQPKDKCSPVKECKVVDTENCLCSEADYNAIVNRLAKLTKLPKANGLHLAPPSSLLLLLSVVVAGLLVSPLDIV